MFLSFNISVQWQVLNSGNVIDNFLGLDKLWEQLLFVSGNLRLATELGIQI